MHDQSIALEIFQDKLLWAFDTISGKKWSVLRMTPANMDILSRTIDMNELTTVLEKSKALRTTIDDLMKKDLAPNGISEARRIADSMKYTVYMLQYLAQEHLDPADVWLFLLAYDSSLKLDFTTAQDIAEGIPASIITDAKTHHQAQLERDGDSAVHHE